MKKSEVVAVKAIISKIIVTLVISAVGAGAYAVVRTYVNENSILNIINSISRIERKIDKFDDKLERLFSPTKGN